MIENGGKTLRSLTVGGRLSFIRDVILPALRWTTIPRVFILSQSFHRPKYPLSQSCIADNRASHWLYHLPKPWTSRLEFVNELSRVKRGNSTCQSHFYVNCPLLVVDPHS